MAVSVFSSRKIPVFFLSLIIFCMFELAVAGTTRHYHFDIRYQTVTRLCHNKSMVTVNGKFPGPRIVAREGDRLLITVVNNVQNNISIHWHGIRQLQSGWADGPAYVTQCPIQTGQSYVYNYTIKGQRGTLFWHAHISWLRSTLYGPLIILPKKNVPYPFAKPHKEVPIIFGEWFNADTEAIIAQALQTGGGPNVSEAYTINGLPGPLYNCSKKDTFKLKVKLGKTYLLRFINAALNDELFFSIANHTLTVVEADAVYVKPFKTNTILIAPGQTTNVLLKTKSHYPNAAFLMAARPYATGLGTFDNTTVAGILEYESPSNNHHGPVVSLKKLPLLKPTLPALNDTSFATKFSNKLRSLANAKFPANVPQKVDKHFFFTVGLGTNPCTSNQTCQGPNGTMFAASVNNVSFILPTTALLQSHFSGQSKGVYAPYFPTSPLHPFNYTGTPPNNTMVSNGTKVVVLPFNTSVQLVMQDTSILGAESHPLHLHGFNFFVVGQGFGNYDPSKDPSNFNLVDPVERNTVGVPSGGWVAIRFLADNPGVWFMHCHLEVHTSWVEAQHRWLRPAEICEILRNYRMFHITSEPHIRPPSGSLFLFDRKVLRYFRKDGHNWRKKKDGKTVKEAHEKLKVGSVDVLHCYYAHGEENENFQRRSYWMLEQDTHIVFVHYLEVKGNKSNTGGNADSDGVISDSQKVNSPSSGFPTSYSSVPSLSTDSMSPTSSMTSLREDADSGDHGQSSVSGTEYIPHFDRDKFRGNDATGIDGLKAHGLASWDTVLHADPSLVSFPSIPSSSLANMLDPEHNILGDFSMNRSGLTIGAGSSQPLQSNWQIPFDDNTGHMPTYMPTFTQSLSLEFESDYGTGLLGNEDRNESSEIDPVMFGFHGEPKEKLAQRNYLEEKVDEQQQDDLKSNSTGEVPSEETISYPLSARRTLLDRDESLRKVDSFNRWITKALGEVDNLNMQSSSGISWSTDECGHVIDDTSLSPSLSQDQLYSINDFSPKWACAESDIEVLIIGSFLKSQSDVTTCNWSCMFGEVEVPAEVVANGILCCKAPPHKVGRVPFYVTCSNRLACSEVREFDFREGYSRNVDYTEFFNSSAGMILHLRLEEFLSLKPAHTLNQTFEGGVEKMNLIPKLISLREEEEYSSKEEQSLFHRQVKEKLYSWLLHKVTESGKGPNVLDKDGQGVLHLAAVLGYDWAITPILTAGVSINFRDVNGWTALHWAASCGRERTVAVLVSMGADCGALTDPSPEFPSGRTAADLASSNGHKGLSGFLAESSLTSHLETLTVDDQQKGGKQEVPGMKTVQTVLERSATPVVYNDMPDALCLKDSLTAVRNATQAADRIHQVFRMQSFQRKQLTQNEDDEFGLLDQQALSLLTSKSSKSGQGDGLFNTAATQIQKKFRGWKKRKEFLIIRQRIVKIQAHVRGHQVRKQYKTVIWSVGILEKVILRWRRKGSGLRGFRPESLNKAPSQPNDSSKEDDYDFLKEGRKQKEEKIQKALSRVKSMVQYPEARAQYRRVLNVVEDFRQKKDSNMGLISSEETVDGVEDLIDIDMLLDDDNFIPIAFD